MPDDSTESDSPDLEPIVRLTRDLMRAAVTLTDTEARFLVDSYYLMQEGRKRSRAQERALTGSGEPHSVISWFAGQSETLENQIVRALSAYVGRHLMGDWLDSIFGVGPVLSAGFLAYIDINEAPTAGHIWSYAGIAGDNQKPWKKGEKRPWNATFKSICWRFSDVQVKFSNNEKCYYGRIYKTRKEYEVARNEAGVLKPIADARLARDKERGYKSKEHGYHEQGILSPGHLDLRARRYCVKLFLSHLHNEWFRRQFGKEPPMPYPIAHLDHVHFIHPPGNDE